MGLTARAAPLTGFPRVSIRRAGFIFLAELILVLIGWMTGSFFLPLAGALTLLFALVAYRSPETAWILTWVMTPLSVEGRLPGGIALALPTEPMIVIALLAWLARGWPWHGLTAGPKSIARPLLAMALIALFSVVVSRFPIIGIKAWIVAALYVAFGYAYFVSTGYRVRRVMLWLAVGVALGSFISLFACFRLVSTGINVHAAYGASRPFFMEHGTYAAYLAFLLPSAILESLALQRSNRVLWAAGAGALLLGLAFSYTRAAWLSILIVVPLCLSIWAIARGSIGRVWIPASIVLVLALGLVVSGVGDRLLRHARTVVDTDNVSNLERFNRWMAAAEMTKAHPWTGVGYGVYPEIYREYRRKSIVTEQSYGRFGVHNELLRMLAETGWAGFAASLWFVFAVGRAGVRVFVRDPHSDHGRLAFGVTCGLATYAVHSVFNSYLGIDKISVPFWVAVGMIASIHDAKRQ